MTGRDKVNILMVDDQPSKLLSYETILSELGENLIRANSGKEALERLLKEDIAVILTDVSMPELDGFTLAEMIRQHPRYQSVAIIFISAVHLTDLDLVKGYQRGAVDYISVPVNPELLRAKVSTFAELHRRARQLEGLNRALRRLSGKLITMQDEERRRIARELHDGLGQDLIAAKMLVDGLRGNDCCRDRELPGAREASEMLGHTINQVRAMSYLLHPPSLDEVGLSSALRWYLDGLAKRSSLDLSLDVEPEDFPRLAPELETAAFRIVQEGLTNVFRHADARHCSVTLTYRERRLSLTVSDDGKGVAEDIVAFRPGSLGVGIGGMLQRVQEFGGDLRLRQASSGTILEAVIPTA